MGQRRCHRSSDHSELIEFISAADIYITPYLNSAQITSGTLAYTLGAGKAAISPKWRRQISPNQPMPPDKISCTITLAIAKRKK
jgi:hypothetical protein